MKLTNDEVILIRCILNHLGDALCEDDRPDHGFNRLKDLKDRRQEVFVLLRKFTNSDRIRQRCRQNDYDKTVNG